MRRLTFVMVVVFSAPLAAIMGQTTGNTGNIVGEFQTIDNRQVAAVIRTFRIKPTQSKPTTVSTAPNGAFSFAGLPAGTYVVCASVPGGGYVDPCLFDAALPEVTVGPGQTARSFLLVKKASTLKVHITDTAQLTAPITIGKPAPSNYLVMGVFAPGGRFHPVIQTAANASGSDHIVTVPLDQPFSFHIRPVGLSVNDANNVTIPANGISILQIYRSNGPTPPTLTYTVTGKH